LNAACRRFQQSADARRFARPLIDPALDRIGTAFSNQPAIAMELETRGTAGKPGRDHDEVM
jgi:hypothetical protein